jgi:hypothetical protein
MEGNPAPVVSPNGWGERGPKTSAFFSIETFASFLYAIHCDIGVQPINLEWLMNDPFNGLDYATRRRRLASGSLHSVGSRISTAVRMKHTADERGGGWSRWVDPGQVARGGQVIEMFSLT